MGMGRGPEWYTKAVGSYMSRALMTAHGLRVVLERVLASEKARGSPAAFNHVVRLVVSCPSSVSREVLYLYCICIVSYRIRTLSCIVNNQFLHFRNTIPRYAPNSCHL